MLEGMERAIGRYEHGAALRSAGARMHATPATLKSILVHRLWLKSARELEQYVARAMPGRTVVDLLAVFRAIATDVSDHFDGVPGESAPHGVSPAGSELRTALAKGAVGFLEQLGATETAASRVLLTLAIRDKAEGSLRLRHRLLWSQVRLVIEDLPFRQLRMLHAAPVAEVLHLLGTIARRKLQHALVLRVQPLLHPELSLASLVAQGGAPPRRGCLCRLGASVGTALTPAAWRRSPPAMRSEWLDLAPVLASLSNEELLSVALGHVDVDAFLLGLRVAPSHHTRRLDEVARLRTTLEPLLLEEGVSWREARRVLRELEHLPLPNSSSAATARSANALVQFLRAELIATQLRPTLEPAIARKYADPVVWERVLAALRAAPLARLLEMARECSAGEHSVSDGALGMAGGGGGEAAEGGGSVWKVDDFLDALEARALPSALCRAQGGAAPPSAAPAEMDVELRLARLRPLHEAKLKRQHVLWEDLRRALLEIPAGAEQPTELSRALEQPHVYFAIDGGATLAAKRQYQIARLHVMLQAQLAKHTLRWEELQPNTESLGLEDLGAAVLAEPEAALRWLLLIQLRPSLMRALHAHVASGSQAAVGKERWRTFAELPLDWASMQPLLDASLTTGQLRQAVDDPEACIDLIIKQRDRPPAPPQMLNRDKKMVSGRV